MRWAVAAALLGGCASYQEPGVAKSYAYLQQAEAAAQSHDAGMALAALDGAESAWLTTADAQGNPCMYYAKSQVRDIGYARDSVKHARWDDARRYIATALAEVGT